MTVHFSIPLFFGKSDLGLDGSGAAANSALANAPVDVTRKHLPTWDRQWGKASKAPEGRMILLSLPERCVQRKAVPALHMYVSDALDGTVLPNADSKSQPSRPSMRERKPWSD